MYEGAGHSAHIHGQSGPHSSESHLISKSQPKEHSLDDFTGNSFHFSRLDIKRTLLFKIGNSTERIVVWVGGVGGVV